jgi:hypothetical protein
MGMMESHYLMVKLSVDRFVSISTAVIKFKNGTIQDIAKINGSPEYLAAMRSMAIDALNRRAGIPSKWSNRL